MMESRELLFRKIKKDRMYYFMFIPVFVFIGLFNYAPMAGIVYSLFNFTPFKKEFIGFDNFISLFTGIRATSFWRAFRNTLSLSVMNLIFETLFAVVLALLLNELISHRFKKFAQTIFYLPYFLSWVVTASIFTLILSPNRGFVNDIIRAFGGKSIYFLAEEKWWTPMFLIIMRWKGTGFGTIIYLAALSGINPELYEAATIDGANRWKQTLYITLPCLATTIMTVFILNLGRVMNIFISVFTLQNDVVLAVSDVLRIFAYRIGLLNSDYGLGTAIGLFRSVVGLILVLSTDYINKRIRGSSLL